MYLELLSEVLHNFPLRKKQPFDLRPIFWSKDTEILTRLLIGHLVSFHPAPLSLMFHVNSSFLHLGNVVKPKVQSAEVSRDKSSGRRDSLVGLRKERTRRLMA